MAAFQYLNYNLCTMLEEDKHILVCALGVFIIAWIGQFIGHWYEGLKPAFFDDIGQLLIGPFFIMTEYYYLLGLMVPYADEVRKVASKKRRKIEDARRSKCQ